MTTEARRALDDCELALQDLAAGAQTEFWPTRWIAVITLLRAVGHVLEKVDQKQASPEMQQRMRAAWRKLAATKPQPHIFHDFIDAERNQTIKQYEIGLGVLVTGKTTPMLGPRTNPRFVMIDGPYKHRDVCELCREAIQFWRDYLDKIDA